ncbi:MAG: Rpn family recombination-promoting nuclease/putative transposase [Treponema sp.]|nr:Rpn family recombination-promoting nuclease/putative transposase [Treponema sp.]
MKINKNFKDSVFTKLFSEPDLLRELYCALGGASLPHDVPVSINTLENVVFMDLYNDISFEIGGKLVVLIEHQSTINPNMGLRLLLYISRVLEKIVTGKNLYSEKQLSIPWPEFYVLYNGEKPFPDEKILRLSELFENPQDLGLPKRTTPLLELEVKVLNINEGRNEELLNRCKKLSEYTTFMAKVRELRKEMENKTEAVNEAVKYCHRYAILKEFLEIHASEVLNMLLTEWNIEDAKEVWKEEAWETGHAAGHVAGHAEGHAVGQVEGKREIARKMKEFGESIEKIQMFTGLAAETIQAL